MKPIVALVLLVFPVFAFSQSSIKYGVKVNGIGLGATRAQVVAKFGKPGSETKKSADECVGGSEMTLTYPGLTFKLWDDARDPKKFSVGWIEIDSPKWLMSGIRIGDSEGAVEKRFGKRTSDESNEDKAETVWFYEMDDSFGPGNTNFRFREGRLVGIMTLWMMC